MPDVPPLNSSWETYLIWWCAVCYAVVGKTVATDNDNFKTWEKLGLWLLAPLTFWVFVWALISMFWGTGGEEKSGDD